MDNQKNDVIIHHRRVSFMSTLVFYQIKWLNLLLNMTQLSIFRQNSSKILDVQRKYSKVIRRTYKECICNYKNAGHFLSLELESNDSIKLLILIKRRCNWENIENNIRTFINTCVVSVATKVSFLRSPYRYLNLERFIRNTRLQ